MAVDLSEPKGTIFDIQRFSIHDGPGIRTTVFLKGCVLRCPWCHNPESHQLRPQLAFYAHMCTGCGRCVTACTSGALGSGAERVDRLLCSNCGECAGVCLSDALVMIGREVGVGEVIDEVLRDRPFYETSGGGMTLSGGEPLYQHRFALALLQAAAESGLHTALETCGAVPWERLEPAARYTNLFLYDIKLTDPAKHARLCNSDNRRILDNARRLAERGAEVLFRTPLVPGVNDSPDDLRALGQFILSLPGRQKLDLMPYHRTGVAKYQALGLAYPLPGVDDLRSTQPHRQLLREMGVQVLDDDRD